jgi:hypothetical protein
MEISEYGSSSNGGMSVSTPASPPAAIQIETGPDLEEIYTEVQLIL